MRRGGASVARLTPLVIEDYSSLFFIQDKKSFLFYLEYRCRLNELLQSEAEIIKFKHDIETVAHERDMIQEKLSNLLEDKVRLELDLNSTTHTIDTLNNELHEVKFRYDSDESRSLSFQIQQTIKNRLLKYDIENKQLHDQLTSLKERYEIDMHMKRIDEEKQNIHIQLLNEQVHEYLNNLQCLEIKNDQLAKEKLCLQNQIQDHRIEFEKTRSEFEANNKHLQLKLNTIQQREQMETTAKFEDIEQENKRLQDRIGEMMQQISQLQVSYLNEFSVTLIYFRTKSKHFNSVREKRYNQEF